MNQNFASEAADINSDSRTNAGHTAPGDCAQTPSRESTRLSVVVPCYNEQRTLESCVDALLEIGSAKLQLEIIIVDDGSTDGSIEIAKRLENRHPQIILVEHRVNAGKGAALRSGFRVATGDFVAIQDADLEYNPQDLLRLLQPLEDNIADVVIGSRFITTHARRVLHFWHSLGNRFLTLLSNMCTDTNLTDMETCYKIFRRELIQDIEIEEDRFGFEPEIVAKIADRRVRIYEMGISYRGRTYDEGKKIGLKDGIRALYCIVRYNAHRAPMPVQFLLYVPIGGAAALVNMIVFMAMFRTGVPAIPAALVAFVVAAVANYLMCIRTIFRSNARWNSSTELTVYSVVVMIIAAMDCGVTYGALELGFSGWSSKAIASASALILNFLGRRCIVFPESQRQPWNSAEVESVNSSRSIH